MWNWRKTLGLIWTLMVCLGASSTLTSCAFSRDPVRENARILIQPQGFGVNSGSSVTQKTLSHQQSLSLPSSMALSSYDCLVVNVMGPDIPADPLSTQSKNNGLPPTPAELVELQNKSLNEFANNPDAYCPYPGRFSKIIPNSGGTQELEVSVSMGKGRIFQIIGMKSPNGQCPKTIQELDELRIAFGNVSDYATVLAQAKADINEAVVPIVLNNSHNDQAPRYLESCHNDSGSAVSPLSPVPVIFSLRPLNPYSNASDLVNIGRYLAPFQWNVAHGQGGPLVAQSIALFQDSACSTAALDNSSNPILASVPVGTSGYVFDNIIVGAPGKRLFAKLTVLDQSGASVSQCSAVPAVLDVTALVVNGSPTGSSSNTGPSAMHTVNFSVYDYIASEFSPPSEALVTVTNGATSGTATTVCPINSSIQSQDATYIYYNATTCSVLLSCSTSHSISYSLTIKDAAGNTVTSSATSMCP